MPFINTLTRRDFMQRALLGGAGLGLAALTNVPPFAARALAEGTIGLSGKKLLFVFLRGGNDGLGSLIPVQDSAYSSSIRSTTLIAKDGATDYAATPGTADFPTSPGATATFNYTSAIRLGNGFAALHPGLKFLAPVYNAGDLALIHRVGYPKQSRSHFDSQNYWENGLPNNNVSKEGILYRTIIESGLAGTSPLSAVSIQSALPVLLRGSGAALTNLTDPLRYDLLGVPNSNTSGDIKATNALLNAQSTPFPDKKSRAFLSLQYDGLLKTLSIFSSINFTEAGNTYVDDVNTDGGSNPYYLFPTSQAKNGGYAFNGNNTAKYVVDQSGTANSFFGSLKAAALILNHTDAVIAGTEMGGFDTHDNQGGATGLHATLQQRIGWALYGLRKYFQIYGRLGSAPASGAKCAWSDVVVVLLTEFGRTTIQNTSGGTDHAEAGVMFLAGGGVKGVGKSGRVTGVVGCHPGGTGVHPSDTAAPWISGPANQAGGVDGSMFGVSDRYLKRSVDYRSVLGKVIRDHLGATQNQLNRIIPGYANEAQEHLLTGGTVTTPIESSGVNTPIIGEPDVLV